VRESSVLFSRRLAIVSNDFDRIFSSSFSFSVKTFGSSAIVSKDGSTASTH
jgi:hypothetical protein